eukprot:350699-Chlamydomonas_euryale.AAC.15
MWRLRRFEESARGAGRCGRRRLDAVEEGRCALQGGAGIGPHFQLAIPPYPSTEDVEKQTLLRHCAGEDLRYRDVDALQRRLG